MSQLYVHAKRHRQVSSEASTFDSRVKATAAFNAQNLKFDIKMTKNTRIKKSDNNSIKPKEAIINEQIMQVTARDMDPKVDYQAISPAEMPYPPISSGRSKSKAEIYLPGQDFNYGVSVGTSPISQYQKETVLYKLNHKNRERSKPRMQMDMKHPTFALPRIRQKSKNIVEMIRAGYVKRFHSQNRDLHVSRSKFKR